MKKKAPTQKAIARMNVEELATYHAEQFIQLRAKFDLIEAELNTHKDALKGIYANQGWQSGQTIAGVQFIESSTTPTLVGGKGKDHETRVKMLVEKIGPQYLKTSVDVRALLVGQATDAALRQHLSETFLEIKTGMTLSLKMKAEKGHAVSDNA